MWQGNVSVSRKVSNAASLALFPPLEDCAKTQVATALTPSPPPPQRQHQLAKGIAAHLEITELIERRAGVRMKSLNDQLVSSSLLSDFL